MKSKPEQNGLVPVSEPADAVNTPETLGVTPRYVLQHNAISRSIHTLSATAKKLTAMAMALLPPNLSSLTVAFGFTDFCKALGYGDGGNQYRLFTAAVHECMGNRIAIEMIHKDTGKKVWKEYTWFSYSEVDEESGMCTMKFSAEFSGVLRELKWVYAKIDLQDIGKLQSKYALRYFEMAKSYESLSGKGGNQAGTWYFDWTLFELREIFSIPAGVYPKTRDFRKYVVEEPVRELNDAGIGLEINTEKIKQGRDLKGIRINCKKTARKVSSKKKGKTAEPPESDPRFSEERKAKELAHLKELHSEEYAELYTYYFEKIKKDKEKYKVGGDYTKGRSASDRAGERLRKKYGIQK